MKAIPIRNIFKELAKIGADVIRYVGIFHVATNYGVNLTYCVGPSMVPTISEKGNLVLIDTFSYRVMNKPYKTGDVVICTCPNDAGKQVCKRIGAVAGDKVNLKYNRSHLETITVPQGHVWLAGDNKANSTDSRSYGPVPLGLCKGRVFYKMGFRDMSFEKVK
jgi:mitochondrial inner membrane protease subunit 1